MRSSWITEWTLYSITKTLIIRREEKHKGKDSKYGEGSRERSDGSTNQ